MVIDPSRTYVHLTAAGGAELLEGGEAFWSRPEADLERHGHGWLVTEFAFTEDWADWEMHPMADELVYLLDGVADFLLERSATHTDVLRLTGRGLVVVPKGVWHTAKVVQAPCRMVFVTMGAGTQHRARSGAA
jgi:mannose-6-phosphate isomerase-like protein (cupin superfamily)